MLKLLETLTGISAPSGHEEFLRDFIEKEIENYCDDVKTDSLGNLIARKKGAGRKIMFAAHMDEIGVIARAIDDNGFIRLGAVGGLYIKELAHRRVEFLNGTVGVIGSEEEAFDKKPTIDKLYIDIGAKNKADAEKRITIGDMAVFSGEYHEESGIVISKALDNRAGCYILMEAMKRVGESENDLYFVFTAQEEVGLRGAKTAAFSIEPDYAVAVDVTDTGDTPNAPVMDVKIGGGAAVKVMDRSVLCDSYVRLMITETARRNGIPYQLEIMTDGGTDAGAIHLSGAGVKTGGISLPTRYIHSPSETASTDDIGACIDLVTALAKEEWK